MWEHTQGVWITLVMDADSKTHSALSYLVYPQKFSIKHVDFLHLMHYQYKQANLLMLMITLGYFRKRVPRIHWWNASENCLWQRHWLLLKELSLRFECGMGHSPGLLCQCVRL